MSTTLEFSELWQRVKSFELDDASAARPFSIVLAEEMEWDLEFTNTAITEYKKYMLLAHLFSTSMVPPIDVDTVWHMHLLYTRSYQDFCRQALGREFLHHEPSKGNDGEQDEYKQIYAETLAKYQEFFGSPLAEIWGGDAGVYAEAAILN